MPILGRTARRVVGAILVTALIPLALAVSISRAVLHRVSATAFQPEFGAHLDRALVVYSDLARSMKRELRSEAEAIAASEVLRAAAVARDFSAVEAEITRAMAAHPALVEMVVETCSGERVARAAATRPVNHAEDRTLAVRKILGAHASDPEPFACLATAPDEPFILAATFTTPRARFDEIESAHAFAQAYHQIERKHREEYLDQTYEGVLFVLLAGTLILAVAAGVLVAGPVTRRIRALADATRPVAAGDLSVRVEVTGNDEVADLGRAFNRMLVELGESHARIEFLRRMSEWQKVGRRLAHEIKNPLTPIKLAVEECHRRYSGNDPAFRRILDTTFEVVDEEVATLHRLVGEFASFARLPRAKLVLSDLGVFLRDQERRLSRAEGEDGLAPVEGLGSVDLVRDCGSAHAGLAGPGDAAPGAHERPPQRHAGHPRRR